MPYTQKHTLFFGGGQKGWTESFYVQTGVSSIAGGIAILSQLASMRSALLGQDLFIHALRVIEVEDAAGLPVKRVGDTFQNQQILAPETAGIAAHPDLSLLIDCQTAGNRKHKTVYLGGIWRSIVDNFGLYVPNAGWNEKLANWKGKLTSLNYGWRSRTPSARVQITGYDVDAEGYVTVTTAGTPFAAITADKFTVNIRGLPTIGKQSPLNGERVVVKVDANKCKTTESFALLPFAGVGFLNTFSYGFSAIADLAGEKVVSRERGAPLLQSRGRR